MTRFLIIAFCVASSFGQQVIQGPTRKPLFSSSSTLNSGLIAYWKLDEASGNATDSETTGTAQDLTDNATVTSAAGKIGTARQFTSASSEWLSRTDGADLSTGNIDYTVAAWVYLDTKGAVRDIIGKWNSVGQREYILLYNNTGDRFEFFVSGNGTSGQVTVVGASTFGSPSTATWYLVIAWHDSVNDQIGISVDAGAADTAAHTTGSFDSTTTFGIGYRAEGTSYMNGRIDEAGFWKKVLTSGERTELYNGGSGKTCCDFAL